MRNVFFKTLYDKRWFILGWSLGMAFLGWLMTIFFPTFHQDNTIEQLVKALPPAFAGLVGDLANLSEIPTYLGAQLFNVRIPMLISIFSILLAVGLTVAEEEKGWFRTLTALPISRAGIVLQKWLAIVVASVLATLAVCIGVELGLLQIGETIDTVTLLRLGGLMALLVVALSSIIFAIGMATGKRGLTTGVGILIAIASFILTTFATSVDWLKDWEKLSIFHYYPAPDIAKDIVHPENWIVYTVLIVVSLIVALIFFRRRDID